MSAVGVSHLRSFVAVAEAGSITGAGRRLYLAQPAVTRQIAALERATSLRLLDRSPRGVQLTEDGRRFLRGAHAVVRAYDDLLADGARAARPADDAQATADVDPEADSVSPVLRLGIEADAPSEVTDAVQAFAHARPGSMWRVARAHEQDLRAMLLQGHLDAGVVWLPPGEEAFGGVVVGHVEFLAAMPTALGVTYPRSVAPAELLKELPLALWDRSEGPAVYDYWMNAITRGAAPVNTLTVPQHDNAQAQMLSAVAAGTAVSVVTESYWQQQPTSGVAVRPFNPPLTAPLHLLWASARPNAWIADLVSAF